MLLFSVVVADEDYVCVIVDSAVVVVIDVVDVLVTDVFIV